MQLTYFNGRGRAEYIRMVLHAADLEFEDHRIEMKDWRQLNQPLPVCCDIYQDVYIIFRATGDEKQKLTKEFAEGNGPRLLGMISKHLEASPTGLVVGDKATLADFCILCTIDQVEVTVPGLSKDKFPIFERHRETVLKKNAKLAAYMEKRPITNF
ncbi:hypothetical protein AHF37_07407 [Paragonimus kellicotti]|nr:hypothetical protein AHF37_07407 [Paragonimus kellicotti]